MTARRIFLFTRGSFGRLKRMFSRIAMLACAMPLAFADGPADNLADKVRPVPPPGEPIPAEVRSELESSVRELSSRIEMLRASTNSIVRKHLPDAEIFLNAVDYALRFDEIYEPKKEIAEARDLLRRGMERATQLQEGKAPWTNETGLMVFGIGVKRLIS